MKAKIGTAKLRGWVLLALGLAITSGASGSDLGREDAIRFRQAGYRFLAWNMARIQDQVVDRRVPFSPEQVSRAALAIQGIANSGMGGLFLPGTDRDSAPIATRALPEVFDPAHRAEFNQAARRFIDQANRFAVVAKTGDPDAIRAQFDELGRACRKCHHSFREVVKQ